MRWPDEADPTRSPRWQRFWFQPMRRSSPDRRLRSTAATPRAAITASSRCSVFPTELHVADIRGQLMRLGVLIVDAETDDAPRRDANDRGVQVITGRTL